MGNYSVEKKIIQALKWNWGRNKNALKDDLTTQVDISWIDG